jgi:hypothetical protein
MHKTIVERVTELEKSFPNLVDAISDNLDRRLNPLLPLINALVEVVGRDTVSAKVKEQRELSQTQEMESQKAQLQVLVAEGRLTKAEVIKDGSVIVAREFLGDGTVVHPGRLQILFSDVAPQFQEKLLGKTAAGTVVELPDNQGKFEVLEVYDFVPSDRVTPVVPAAVESPR